jgi:uncharacterized membrane protein YtjA (UPF0391 family)
MISAAIAFFVIALIAAVLGFTGIVGAAVNLAWICAVVGIILALIFGVLGRRPPYDMRFKEFILGTEPIRIGLHQYQGAP